MQCPSCGFDNQGALHLKVGPVRVSTCHCKECGKVWRQAAFIEEMSVSQIEAYLSGVLTGGNRVGKSSVVFAINFMRARVSGSSKKTLEQRRLDRWEQEFMKKALGED